MNLAEIENMFISEVTNFRNFSSPKNSFKYYRVVKFTNAAPGDVDTNEIKKLSGPLKAIASSYSARGRQSAESRKKSRSL